jgi:hypothetical protein
MISSLPPWQELLKIEGNAAQGELLLAETLKEQPGRMAIAAW